MAVTLEFWQGKIDGTIMVQYNLRNYKLREFLLLDEADEILTQIHKAILDQYPKYASIGDKYQCVGRFIRDHFLKSDNQFDIIILDAGSGGKVIFNFEDMVK